MAIVICFLVMLPSLWFAELINDLKTANEAWELFGSTFFFVTCPVFIVIDLVGVNLELVFLASYFGFSASAIFHKWVEY